MPADIVYLGQELGHKPQTTHSGLSSPPYATGPNTRDPMFDFQRLRTNTDMAVAPLLDASTFLFFPAIFSGTER
jgi:hypothetical protein